MIICDQCGVSISDGSEFIYTEGKDEIDSKICQRCASLLENTSQRETKDINIIGAFTFGLGAAVITAAVWYAITVITNYELGIIAIAVGWLVTQAVMLGTGRKRGPVVQIISVVSIFVAMALGEYLIIRHFIIKSGLGDFPLLLPVDKMVTLLIDVIKEDPQILIFWIIALLEGIVIPAKRKLKLTRAIHPAIPHK